MALIIPVFKNGGQEFENAYAKVSEIKYNNDTKVATFSLKVFKSKEDKNLIVEFPNLYVKMVTGADFTTQCYLSIKRAINETKAAIAAKQAEADLIVEDDTIKLMLLSEIDRLQNKDVIQLDGAISDLPVWKKPEVVEPAPEEPTPEASAVSDEPTPVEDTSNL